MTRPYRLPFWEGVSKTTTCWLWKRSKLGKGYGWAWFESRGEYAHRVAWILTNGPIPKNKQVLHRCDIKLCVRPYHLYLGTRKDNAQDALARGQFVTGERHHMKKIAYRKRHSDFMKGNQYGRKLRVS